MPIGTVSEFDVVRGLGTIMGDDASTYLFHCLEIVDGTRTVEVGRAVTFDLLPRFGEYQAARIVKV